MKRYTLKRGQLLAIIENFKPKPARTGQKGRPKMAKRFNYQEFALELKSGEKITIQCSSARYWDHTSQRARVHRYFRNADGFYSTYSEYTGYAQYINRPWERFDYETAIHALARDFDKNGEREIGQEIRNWIEDHDKKEAEEADKFVADFKREWEKASPGLKSAIQAGGMIETEEQAKSTLAVLKMGNFLRSMENSEK